MVREKWVAKGLRNVIVLVNIRGCMSRLILLRHGQSEWNKKNLFTGWIDIPLSVEGIEEAMQAGKELAGLPIDIIYTSTLIRGIMTAMLALSIHHSGKVPVILHEGEGKLDKWAHCHSQEVEATLIPTICAWQLNERMYGDLQGLDKQKTREKYGEEQFKLWRRSYAVAPPHGESLKMTAERTLPYFREKILPTVAAGKNVLVSAHGNSLRSIVMEIDQLTEEEVVHLEIPTGRPLYYTFREGKLRK